MRDKFPKWLYVFACKYLKNSSWSKISTGSVSLKHSPVDPKAFTERGLVYAGYNIKKVRELPQLLLPLSNHSLS